MESECSAIVASSARAWIDGNTILKENTLATSDRSDEGQKESVVIRLENSYDCQNLAKSKSEIGRAHV